MSNDKPTTEPAFMSVIGWPAEAACLDRPPDLWFPTTADEAHAGVDICAECPVSRHYYDYTIDNGITEGTWGGVTEWERTRRTKRSRRGWINQKRSRAARRAHLQRRLANALEAGLCSEDYLDELRAELADIDGEIEAAS